MVLDHGIKFQDSICNGCHNLTMLCISINVIAIITVKGVYYSCIIQRIRKFEAINLLENSVRECRGYA